MSEINIEMVENGFVIHKGNRRDHGLIPNIWVFQSPEDLSLFIKTWAEKQLEEKEKQKE